MKILASKGYCLSFDLSYKILCFFATFATVRNLSNHWLFMTVATIIEKLFIIMICCRDKKLFIYYSRSATTNKNKTKMMKLVKSFSSCHGIGKCAFIFKYI